MTELDPRNIPEKIEDWPDLSPAQILEGLTQRRREYFNKMMDAGEAKDLRAAEIYTLFWQGTSYERRLWELLLRVESLENRLAVNDGR